MWLMFYFIAMALFSIGNEFEPNKYFDNAHIALVLLATFCGLMCGIGNQFTEQMVEKLRKTPEKIGDMKNRSNYYYFFIFANVALCFVFGLWLRGIFLFFGGIGFYNGIKSTLNQLGTPQT